MPRNDLCEPEAPTAMIRNLVASQQTSGLPEAKVWPVEEVPETAEAPPEDNPGSNLVSVVEMSSALVSEHQRQLLAIVERNWTARWTDDQVRLTIAAPFCCMELKRYIGRHQSIPFFRGGGSQFCSVSRQRTPNGNRFWKLTMSLL